MAVQEGHGQRKKHVEIVNVGVWEQLCGRSWCHWFMEGEERTLACGGCRKGGVEGMIPGEVTCRGERHSRGGSGD